jgi:hypothetical protein
VIRLLLLLLAVGAGLLYLTRLLARRDRERLALIRSTFLVGTAATGEVGPAQKDAGLHDGTLFLRIPEHWAEEYPDRHHAAFRDPNVKHRILRMTTEFLPEEDPRSLLQSRAGADATTVEDLPDGRVLLKALDAAREEGQDLVAFRWLMATVEAPSRVRLATFALSLPAQGALDPLTRDLVALLDREIRASRIATK